MSFTKKFKKKSSRGENLGEPPTQGQFSTLNSENEQLDPGAYTEINPNAGQTKAAQVKGLFAKGFKKATQAPAIKDGYRGDDLMRLYPGPQQPWNISGSDKVAAAAGGMGPLAPQTSSAHLPNPTLNTLNRPKRVTPDLGPYGAPKGTSGVTGVPNTHPFQHSYGKFGRNPRKALKSITRLNRGM